MPKKIKIKITKEGEDTAYSIKTEGEPTAFELGGAIASLARLLSTASGRTVQEVLRSTMKIAEDGKDA